MPHPVHSSFLFLYVSSKNSTRFLLLLVELFSIFDPVCLFWVIESDLKVCRSNSDTPCIDQLLVMLVLLVTIVQKYTNESDMSAKKSLTFLSLLHQTSLLGVMYIVCELDLYFVHLRCVVIKSRGFLLRSALDNTK
jgi:hypothetical protein